MALSTFWPTGSICLADGDSDSPETWRLGIRGGQRSLSTQATPEVPLDDWHGPSTGCMWGLVPDSKHASVAATWEPGLLSCPLEPAGVRGKMGSRGLQRWPTREDGFFYLKKPLPGSCFPSGSSSRNTVTPTCLLAGTFPPTQDQMWTRPWRLGAWKRDQAEGRPSAAAMPPTPVSLASMETRCVWTSLAACAPCPSPAGNGSVFLSLSHCAQ